MTSESDPAAFLGLTADERLLADHGDALPAEIGRPEAVLPSRARARVVGLGATLTGVTLVLGVVLIVLAVIGVISSGFGLLEVLGLALGAVLIATHWGWVHVAEVSANALEARHSSPFLARRHAWLESIQPYTRYEVTTAVEDDGSIGIARVRYLPIATGKRTFAFERTVEERELHAPDEPGAAVAERAELLRRAAARDTASERRRYEVAADVYETALLGQTDEEHRRAAQRAASEALSQQINTNLREPPLVE